MDSTFNAYVDRLDDEFIDYTKKMEVKNTEIDFHLLEIDEGLVSHLDQHGKLRKSRA